MDAGDTANRMQTAPHPALVGVLIMLHGWHTQDHLPRRILFSSPAPDAMPTISLYHQLAPRPTPHLLPESPLSVQLIPEAVLES